MASMFLRRYNGHILEKKMQHYASTISVDHNLLATVWYMQKYLLFAASDTDRLEKIEWMEESGL